MRVAGVWFVVILASVRAVGGEVYEEPPISERDRQHWAFQSVRTDFPAGTTIDRLALERLREATGGKIPDLAPPAGPRTLLRRLHFTLIGLPPSLEEVEAFTGSPEEIESVIDDLLARPQYGERWGQHWLDVARFAETDGFEHDKVRPEAWRYRDWVIDALNRDLPYDEFLSHQIAGDEISLGDPVARLGTGFIFAGPDMPDINLAEERRHVVLNETTSTVGAAFLGLSIGCAQCHDHRSDPVSQADFYRLRAFFDNVKMPPKNKSLPHFFEESKPSNRGSSVLRIRGDFRRVGPQVEPEVLRIANLSEPDADGGSPARAATGRRSDLANWLTDPRHPLVTRVIVNRIWQHHFGTGLVNTPNDFGLLGDRPSHPDLLDFLAADLVENGWSLKRLHKKILLSRTWRQASREMPGDRVWRERLGIDPDGRLLSRRMRLRLSGEEIRDAMLFATGELNLEAGGPGFRPPLPHEVTVTLLKNQWEVSPDPSDHTRRSIYLFARRNLRYPLFEVFDRPDGNESCGRRHTSTTAPQSLLLLNSAFSGARARQLANRLEGEITPGERVRRGFLLTLSREPSGFEASHSQRFLGEASLDEFALALFNLNEFVYLD